MKIIIKTTNVKLTPALTQYVQDKIGSLEKFIEDLVGKEYFEHFLGKGKAKVEAWVEIGKTTRHHRKGLIFRAEVQLRFPGKSVRAEALSGNLRRAVAQVKDELQRELKEYKGKAATLAKRRARVAKKELKIAPQARLYRKGRIREEGT